MSKRRKEIRNEVVAILKKSKVVTSENIRANRSTTYEAKKLPAISVYTRSDVVGEELASAPRLLRKNLELICEVVLQDDRDDEAANTLDDLCERIEHYLSSDDSLSKKADDLVLERVDFDFRGENIDKPLHVALMNFRVEYSDFYPRDRSLQESKPFEGIDAEWQVGHHHGDPTMAEDDRAQDTINLPQS